MFSTTSSMTRKPVFRVALVTWVAIIMSITSVAAQESPEPTASPTPTISASPTAAARNVRISFVPPPLDGTISLGIFDTAGKLVRVLHQQASLDAFTIGADALQTKWDGKDDDGQDAAPGKYHARGFAVGALRVENITTAEGETPAGAAENSVTVKLVANPLQKDQRSNVELAVGFDDTDSYLETADQLPLFILSERSDITGLSFSRSGDKTMDVWQQS